MTRRTCIILLLLLLCKLRKKTGKEEAINVNFILILVFKFSNFLNKFKYLSYNISNSRSLTFAL